MVSTGLTTDKDVCNDLLVRLSRLSGNKFCVGISCDKFHVFEIDSQVNELAFFYSVDELIVFLSGLYVDYCKLFPTINNSLGGFDEILYNYNVELPTADITDCVFC